MGRIILSAITRFSNREAIADDQKCWSYSLLGDQIGRAISVLRSAGLRRGEGIAILASNRAELVAVEFAAMLMGARYTPLHPLAAHDTHLFILADAEVAILVADPKVVRNPLMDMSAKVPSLRTIFSFGAMDGAIDLISAMHSAKSAALQDEAEPSELVRLLYTGGTTGRPKGVMIPHRTMVTTTVLQASEWELPNPLIFLACTPVSHASGAFLPTILMQGGKVRLSDGFSVEKFCRLVPQEKISFCFLVPTMIYVLLDHREISSVDFSTLKTVVYGAAPISTERLRAALKVFGSVFVQLYGQTEVPMCITTLRKIDHDPDNGARLGSCGLPSPLIQVRLLDSNGVQVPDGEPGEICVRGPLLSNGYWKRPEANAETFKDGWLHTGDVAVRDCDGYYSIVDRTSDLIISGGFNIFPSEVEDVLNAHPAVALCAVVGLPDKKWGEAVTAFVQLRPNATADDATLKAHVKALRGSVWTPKRVVFVESIPLTAVGKIDRKVLRKI
jgi:fatty-acyl-CoA synthase